MQRLLTLLLLCSCVLGQTNIMANKVTANSVVANTTNGTLNASRYPGTDIGAKVNAAEASTDCPISGCHIVIPAVVGGVYNQTTQIIITKTIFLECDGTSAQANITNHQTVTLNWTGGATQQILVNGAAATGWKIKGCGLNNNGSATWGLDIDNAAGESILQEFAIVEPSVMYSGGGIRVGNTSAVVSPHFKDVNVRAAGPVGINLVFINAHFVGERVRSSNNTVNDWVLGTPTTDVLSFSCYGCIVESNSGVTGYSIIRAQGARWIGGYCETGGSATKFCWDVPNTAARAAGLEIIGNFISCVRAPCPGGAVHSNFASADISFKDNLATSFSAGNAFIQNDAIGGGQIEGNDSDTGGFLEASSFTNIVTQGNRIANILQPARMNTLTVQNLNSTGTNAVQVNVAAGSSTGGLSVGDGNGNAKFFVHSSGHINQGASGTFAGTCTMSAGTSCTFSLGNAYAITPGCVATIQGGSAVAGACSVSGTTVTITAASANSATWAAMLFGNPN